MGCSDQRNKSTIINKGTRESLTSPLKHAINNQAPMFTIEKQEDGKHQMQSKKLEALISFSRYLFDNPTGQFEFSHVQNLLSKKQPDPMANKPTVAI